MNMITPFKKSFSAALLAVGLLGFTGAVQASGIYVSPEGSDLNPGTQEKPLATLAAARDAPGFISRQSGDFRLRDDSPAFKTGFKPLPWDKIGLQNDAFRKTAKRPWPDRP